MNKNTRRNYPKRREANLKAPRKSTVAKVAAKKNEGGMSLMEQLKFLKYIK